ncbi:hypothetical protein [Dongshaea marina]|uniref:hypothetical protein n=1 Tax=Dongshaea marina TaxID=2047966 RepID=UPI00131F3CD7|nr:hypothetical protein [Dongshaea marina]
MANALKEAEEADTGVYLEIMIDADLIAPGCDFLFSQTGLHFGQEGRSWESYKSGKNRRKALQPTD